MESDTTTDLQGSSSSERDPNAKGPGGSTYPPGYVPRTSNLSPIVSSPDIPHAIQNENEEVDNDISSADPVTDDSSQPPVSPDVYGNASSDGVNPVVTHYGNEEPTTKPVGNINQESAAEVDPVGLTGGETDVKKSTSTESLTDEFVKESETMDRDLASNMQEDDGVSIGDQVRASDEPSTALGGSDESFRVAIISEEETPVSGPDTDLDSVTGQWNADIEAAHEVNQAVLEDANSVGVTDNTEPTRDTEPDGAYQESTIFQDDVTEVSIEDRIDLERTEASHHPDSEVTAESDQVGASSVPENRHTGPIDLGNADDVMQAENITESREPIHIESDLQPNLQAVELAEDTSFSLPGSPDIDIIANGITFTSFMSLAIILLMLFRRSNRARKCCCCSAFFQSRAPTKLGPIGASGGSSDSSFLKSIRTVCHGVHEELSALRNHQTRTEMEYLKSSNQVLASFNSQVAVATPPTARRTRIPSLNDFQ